MKFHAYQPSNRYYNHKFGRLQTEFPYAFLLFDRLLRFSLVDYSLVPYVSRVNIGKWILCIIYRKLIFPIVFLACRHCPKNNFACCMVGINSFPYLHRRLLSHLHHKGVHLFGGGRAPVNCGFLSPYLFIHLIPLSTFYFFCLFLRIEKVGMDDILSDQNILSIIDKRVKSEVEIISRILERLSIKLVISLGDDQPVPRVLIEAASRVECKYYVVAHGYITDPTLLCIAPIRAGKLFVWSDKQRADLVSVMDSEEAKKVKYVGSPFKVYNAKSLSTHYEGVLKCLIVLDPRDASKNPQRLTILNDIVRLLTSHGVNVIIRRHPQDINRYPNPEEIILNKFVRISLPKEFLNSQLEMVDFVIGENSSVMFQASLYGKQSIQISELALAEVEGATKVSVCDLDKFLFGEKSILFTRDECSSQYLHYEMCLDSLTDISDESC